MTQQATGLLEYNVTPAKLDALTALTDRFDGMKQAPRLAVGSRSANNASVPALLSKMQVALTMLDNILKGLDDIDPLLLAEYPKARVVIHTRGSGKDDADINKPKA